MAERELKVVLVGDEVAKKTQLTLAFGNHPLCEGIPDVVYDNYKVDVTVDGNRHKVALWDTAGQEDYARLRPLSYPETNVFLLCFSVTSRKSFFNVAANWLPELVKFAVGVPIVLVGTNSDQGASTPPDQCVSVEEATQQASSLGFMGYFECSQMTLTGVADVLEAAVRAALGNSLPTSGRKRQLIKNK